MSKSTIITRKSSAMSNRSLDEDDERLFNNFSMGDEDETGGGGGLDYIRNRIYFETPTPKGTGRSSTVPLPGDSSINIEVFNHENDDYDDDDDEPLIFGIEKKDDTKIAISIVPGTNDKEKFLNTHDNDGRNLPSSIRREGSSASSYGRFETPSPFQTEEGNFEEDFGSESGRITAFTNRSEDAPSVSTTTSAVLKSSHYSHNKHKSDFIPSGLASPFTKKNSAGGLLKKSATTNNVSIQGEYDEEDTSHLKDDPLAVNLKPSRTSYVAGSTKKGNSDAASTVTSLAPNSLFSRDQAVFNDPNFHDLTEDELINKQKKLGQKKVNTSNAKINLNLSQAQTTALGPEALSELKRKMEIKEEDMEIMNGIIDFAKKEESKLLQKTGNFSTVAKYERESKRQDEKRNISQLLTTVKKRQHNEKEVTKKNEITIPMSSKKNKWVEDAKKKGRENLKEHLFAEKMEDFAIQARINHEKTVENYKIHYDNLFAEHQQALQQIKIEKENVTKHQEENKSLKYTIEMLRQKLGKQSVREIEKEQKLRLFSNYEPLFETLQKNFNFDSPYDVIRRIEMLEKAQSDSFTQLLESQEQKNALERQFEKYKTEMENKHRKAIGELEKQIERDQNQIKENNMNMKKFQQTLDSSENFRQKFLVLSDSVIDLWHTWVKDVEKLGYRDTTVFYKNGEHSLTGGAATLLMHSDPDFSDSSQVMSAVKNLLIAFTPNKAGHSYSELAKMANGYWLKYFKTDFDIKSKPKQIFEKMAQSIDVRNTRIKELERKNKEMEILIKQLDDDKNKATREKRALEVQVNVGQQFQRPQSAGARLKNIKSPTLHYIYGAENKEKKTNSRPQSARVWPRPQSGVSSPSNNANRFRPSTAKSDHPTTATTPDNSRPSSSSSMRAFVKRPMSAPSNKRPQSSSAKSTITDSGGSFFITQVGIS